MEQTLLFHVKAVQAVAMTEGMETVTLPWMELKWLVDPLKVLVLRHFFFLVLVPHFGVGGVPCPRSYQLRAGGWELGQASCLPYKIAVVQKASYRLHHICWPEFLIGARTLAGGIAGILVKRD